MTVERLAETLRQAQETVKGLDPICYIVVDASDFGEIFLGEHAFLGRDGEGDRYVLMSGAAWRAFKASGRPAAPVFDPGRDALVRGKLVLGISVYDREQMPANWPISGRWPKLASS